MNTQILVSKKIIKKYNINDENLSLYLISSTCTNELDKIYSFWYKIYCDEMGYSKDCLTNMEIKPNSLILFFEKDDEVVGTLKLDYSIFGDLEFDYNKYLNEDNPNFLEVSKFLIKKEYRKSVLGLNLILVGHKLSEQYNPKYIVINSALAMKDYYLKLGFSLLSEEIIIHPKIKNESCLMIADYPNFKENILKK